VTSRVDYYNAVLYTTSPETIPQQAAKGDERGRSSCRWHL